MSGYRDTVRSRMITVTLFPIPKGVTVSEEPCNNCSVAVKGYRRGTDGHKNRRETAGFLEFNRI